MQVGMPVRGDQVSGDNVPDTSAVHVLEDVTSAAPAFPPAPPEVVARRLPDVSDIANDLEILREEVARGTSPPRKKARTVEPAAETPRASPVALGFASGAEHRRGEKRARTPSPFAPRALSDRDRSRRGGGDEREDRKAKKDKKKKSRKSKKSKKHRRRSSSASSDSSSSLSSHSSVFRVTSASGVAASQLRLVA